MKKKFLAAALAAAMALSLLPANALAAGLEAPKAASALAETVTVADAGDVETDAGTTGGPDDDGTYRSTLDKGGEYTIGGVTYRENLTKGNFSDQNAWLGVNANNKSFTSVENSSTLSSYGLSGLPDGNSGYILELNGGSGDKTTGAGFPETIYQEVSVLPGSTVYISFWYSMRLNRTTANDPTSEYSWPNQQMMLSVLPHDRTSESETSYTLPTTKDETSFTRSTFTEGAIKGDSIKLYEYNGGEVTSSPDNTYAKLESDTVAVAVDGTAKASVDSADQYTYAKNTVITAGTEWTKVTAQYVVPSDVYSVYVGFHGVSPVGDGGGNILAMASVKTALLDDAYVSATNGNDNTGGGTREAPFKTLEKALDWVKTGGTIHVMDDLTLSSAVTVNKSVTILSDNNGKLDDDEQHTILRGDNCTAQMLIVTGAGVEVTLKNIIFDGKNIASYNALRVEASATLTLDTGAVVQNNSATGSGTGEENDGAVVVNDATLNIKPGAEIKDNATKGRGGGVSTRTANAVVNMTGGSITGNKRTVTSYPGGGGVYIEMGTFNMSGGSITGNSDPVSGGYGGGVFVSSKTSNGVTTYGKLNVSGSAVITGNTSGEEGSAKEDNVYLPIGQTIGVTGELNDDAEIGVTSADTSSGRIVVATGGTVDDETYAVTEADAEKFASDNSAYQAEYNAEGDGTAPTIDLVFSKDYYVSAPLETGATKEDDKVYGDDTSGNGTAKNPYATIQKAYSQILAGGKGVIHVMSDLTLTSSQAFTAANTVTILSDSNGDLTDDEAFALTWQYNNSDVDLFQVGATDTVCNLTLQNITVQGDKTTEMGRVIAIYNGTVALVGATIQDFVYAGAKDSGNKLGKYFIALDTQQGGTRSLTMDSDSVIKNNKLESDNSGKTGDIGLFGVGGGHTATLSGTFSGNTVTADGAWLIMVGTVNNSQLTLDGASVINNTMSNKTYALRASLCSSSQAPNVLIKGATKIANNTTESGEARNVYLSTNGSLGYIQLDTLASGASIGVSSATAPSDTADVKIAANATADDRVYFHSDQQDVAGVIYCDGESDKPVTGHHTCATEGTSTANTLWLSTAAAGAVTVTSTDPEGKTTTTAYAVDAGDNSKYTTVDAAISAALADAAKSNSGVNTISVSENPKETVSGTLQSGDTLVIGGASYQAVGGTDSGIAIDAEGNVTLNEGSVKIAIYKEIQIPDPYGEDGATMTISTKRNDGMTVTVDENGVASAKLTASEQGVDIAGGSLNGVKILSNAEGYVYFDDPIGAGCQVRLPENTYALPINENATVTAVTGTGDTVKIIPVSGTSGATVEVPEGMTVTISGVDEDGNAKEYTLEGEGTWYVTADGRVYDKNGEAVILLNEGDLGSVTNLSGGMTSYQLPNALVLGTDIPNTFEVSVDRGYFKVGSDTVGTGVEFYAALTASGKVVDTLDASAAYTYVSFTVSDGATLDALQTWLRGVTFYKDTKVEQNVTARGENVALENGVESFVGHYYQFVPATITWSDAYKDAKSKTFNGLTGYLITIADQQEHDYIYQKFGKNGWMGATRAVGDYNADASTYTYASDSYAWDWYWVCGPEAGTRIGTQNASGGGMTAKAYANWKSGEPNGKSVPGTRYEGFGQYGYGSNGLWNDLPDKTGSGHIQGYYVEYGGYADDAATTPAAQDTRAVGDLTGQGLTVGVTEETDEETGVTTYTLTASPVDTAKCDYVLADGDGKVVASGEDVVYVLDEDTNTGYIAITEDVASGGTYQVVAVAKDTEISDTLTEDNIVQASAKVTLAAPVDISKVSQTEDVDGDGNATGTISITLPDATDEDMAYALIDQTTGEVIGWSQGEDGGVTFAGLDPTHAYAAVEADSPATGDPLAVGETSVIYPDPLLDDLSAVYEDNGTVTVTVENPVDGAEYWAVAADGSKIGPATVDSDGNVTISGLKPETEYEIVAVAEDTKKADVPASGTAITTPAAPVSADDISRDAETDEDGVTTDSVTVSNTKTAVEYALVDQNGNFIDQNGELSETPVWVKGNGGDLTWAGLDPDSSYTVLTRPADDETAIPAESEAIDPLPNVTVEGVAITVSPADEDKVYALLDGEGNVVVSWTEPTSTENADGTYSVPTVVFDGLILGAEYEVVCVDAAKAEGVDASAAAGKGVSVTTDETVVIPAEGGSVDVTKDVTVAAPAGDGENTGSVTVTAANDEDPATVTVEKAGDSFTVGGVDFVAGADDQEFFVDEDGTVTVTLDRKESVTIDGVVYTGPAIYQVTEDGVVDILELIGKTATTFTLRGPVGATYTVTDADGNEVEGAVVTVDEDGKVTVSGLEKGTEYTVSSEYGDVTAKTSDVNAEDIAKAFDKDAADSDGDDTVDGEADSAKVTVTVDENGNYVVTLLDDITPEDTGAAAGEATVTIGDDWGEVTLDLNGHTISGADATEDAAATAAIGFVSTETDGDGVDLTVTSSAPGGAVVGGNGSADGEHTDGADGITADKAVSDAALTLEGENVTVSGGDGADTDAEGADGGNGGSGVVGELPVTVIGSTVSGGDGGSSTGGNGGDGGSGVDVSGDVTVTDGATISGGDGGVTTAENGSGGNGGSGVNAEGDVTVVDSTLTGGDAGTGGSAGLGLVGDGSVTGDSAVTNGAGENAATVSAGMTTITVSNAAVGATYTLYDAEGNQIDQCVAADSAVVFSQLSPGTTYVVKVTDENGVTSVLAAVSTRNATVASSQGTTTSSAGSDVGGAGKVEGGTISISPDKPAEGTTVTITLTPDEGYVLDSLKVLDKNGDPVALTANEDGTYSFTMPEGGVTIDAVFRALEVGYADCDRDENCPAYVFDDLDLSLWYHDGIHFCVENGYMVGVGGDRFAPDGVMTRAELVTVLWRVSGAPETTGETFPDVADDAWYAQAVAWGVASGVVKGYGNGDFGPADPITREQLALMLYRYAGSPDGEDADITGYNDKDEISDWAADALPWAVESGIITGKDGDLFDPRGDASRAEAATMLMRYLEGNQ